MPRPGSEAVSAYTRFNDEPTPEDLEVGFGDDVQRIKAKTGGRLGYASPRAKPSTCDACSCAQWVGISLGGFIAMVPSTEVPHPFERDAYFVGGILLAVCALAEALAVRAAGHKCFAFCSESGRANPEYCEVITQAALDVLVVMVGYGLGLAAESAIPNGGAAVVGGIALVVYIIVLAFRRTTQTART